MQPKHFFLLAFAAIASATSALSQTENILYTFKSEADGYSIGGSALVLDKAGILFGTTTSGGINNCGSFYPGCGTIYQLQRPAQPGDPWVKNTIWRFQGGVDGGLPSGLLVKDGKLIGQTGIGGSGTCSGGCGYLYLLTPPPAAGGIWTKTVLYEFPDAAAECGIYTFDAAGNFFGVGSSTNGNGSICKLSPPSESVGSWSVTTLYTFKGNAPGQSFGDGSGPLGVVFDKQGNLWGATNYGGYCQLYEGGSCFGTIFRVSPPAQPGGPWTETLLYRFSPNDQNPNASVVLDSAGAVYGTTLTEVYRLAGPVVTVLDHFPDTNGNASAPTAGVILDEAGNLYGTSGAGGQFDDGTVYKLTRPASGNAGWTQTILHSFAGGSDGFNPEAPLTLGPNGVVYGTTQNGGNDACNMGGENIGCGIVFDVIPSQPVVEVSKHRLLARAAQ
jgi:uncharacterized repeat protein (TIGR03803 family)